MTSCPGYTLIEPYLSILQPLSKFDPSNFKKARNIHLILSSNWSVRTAREVSIYLLLKFSLSLSLLSLSLSPSVFCLFVCLFVCFWSWGLCLMCPTQYNIRNTKSLMYNKLHPCYPTLIKIGKEIFVCEENYVCHCIRMKKKKKRVL